MSILIIFIVYIKLMPKTIKEEINRLKELMYPKSKDEVLKEEIMYGDQSGYPDDSSGDNDYDFVSKGALGSEPELEDEGFTEPETNYSKEKEYIHDKKRKDEVI